MNRLPALLLAAVVGISPAGAVLGQSVTLPPSGGNQKASVSQSIGLVEVTITYSSPDVTGPSGEDRTGQIWGQLVPYGLANLGFGSCTECPWRAGANENTTFTVSHDVLIEGQPLPAGTYGLHMIPSETTWTLIFSNNATSWGSFFYDPSEDALRVTVTPEPHPFREWLTYDFIDRGAEQARVALVWENLMVPFTIGVEDLTGLYVANLREELRSTAGFNWQGWSAAATYGLTNETNLEEALQWAQNAVSLPFIGQENFATLTTLALLQDANALTAEAEATMEKALYHPTADPMAMHQFGRQMITQGRAETALRVFEVNAERHPDTWPINVGLARGHSALGNYEEALRYAKLALAEAPDDLNRQNLQQAVQLLEEGKDIN